MIKRNFNLTKKICENKDLGSFGIKFKLHKDKIILIFNETDELAFFNNNTGLIEKLLLVQDNQENNIKENQFNSSTIKKQPCNNYKFKVDVEILIRLYYYNRYINEKVNLKFDYLNKENSRSVYLINNNWLEHYKEFYEYKILENYLNGIKNDNIYSTNDDYISSEDIEKLILNLPMSYIQKLEAKNR